MPERAKKGVRSLVGAVPGQQALWAASDVRRRTFGELLIDLEEDNTLKAVIWGLLREMERR